MPKIHIVDVSKSRCKLLSKILKISSKAGPSPYCYLLGRSIIKMGMAIRRWIITSYRLFLGLLCRAFEDLLHATIALYIASFHFFEEKGPSMYTKQNSVHCFDPVIHA